MLVISSMQDPYIPITPLTCNQHINISKKRQRKSTIILKGYMKSNTKVYTFVVPLNESKLIKYVFYIRNIKS